MLQRALFIIGIPLLLLVLVVWFFFFYWPTQNQGIISEEPPVTLPIAGSATSSISTPTSTILSIPGRNGLITTKDFYKTASYTTPQNDAVLAESESFRILYYPADSSFTISLVSKPLDAARQAAEKILLSQLGISEEEACNLKIFVGTPRWVDEDVSGQNLGLTFCQ